jgi:peptidoglycan-N-acetylglucosamine deacetylase
MPESPLTPPAPLSHPPPAARERGETAWRPSPLVLASLGLHAAGVLAAAAAPRRWPWIAGALVANHVVLTAAGLWPQSPYLGPNLVRLPDDAARRGEIALTFDDGPDPEATPGVLDLLDHWGARASFFLIGRRAAARPDLAAEIVRRGHRVENHTWSHPAVFACYLAPAQRRQIRRAQEAIARVAGQTPSWFRAPAGFRNPLLDRELCAAGLRLASWTRRGYDTVERDPVRVARRLTRGLGGGDVLLLHDGSAARDRRGRPVLLEALPRVLEALAARGLRAVPLGDRA